VAGTGPDGARTSRIQHRVPFYETDAMGVVHHSNYVRYLELVRIRWLDEHDQPYRDYVAQGFHYATTHVAVDYHRSAAYDDVLDVEVWLEELRGASLRMAYRLACGDQLIASAVTEHALVDENGRPRRIPAERRDKLALCLTPDQRVERRGRRSSA
jgi:acyl-CoA thioester hydrolase